MAHETFSTGLALETEGVSSDMMGAALAQCRLAPAAERALEWATTENAPPPADDETAGGPEVETAAEIALKNGVYHEIRRKLQQRFGIPSHEIAFIHDADTPAKKAALFESVNAGRVRVLLGSTAKLGTGVNVQKRLVALHHVDQPWKPAELEQREGRILRQGNIYPEVFVFHYVTERSFDGYMLQTLEAKARFISQIMAGEVTARTAEDVGDMVLTVAQVKAIASGNPLVQRRIETEVQLVKLDRLRAAFYNQRAALRADITELPQSIAAQEAEIAGHERALQVRQPLAEDAFQITLRQGLEVTESVVFQQRERAGGRLRHLADLLTEQLRRGAGRGSLSVTVGTYRGFSVAMHVAGNSRFAGLSSLFDFRAEIHLRAAPGGVCYVANIGESNVGVTQSMDYQLRHIESRLAQAQSRVEMLRARLTQAQEEVSQPWAHAAGYARLRREYEALGRGLQAEGIALENALVFAVDEDAPEPEEMAENAATPIVEETGLARNPFTGLEEWPLLAQETGADEEVVATICAETTPAQLDFLNFTVTDTAGAPAQEMSSTPAAPLAEPAPAPILPGARLPLLAQAGLLLPHAPAASSRRHKTSTPRRRPEQCATDGQGSFSWGA